MEIVSFRIDGECVPMARPRAGRNGHFFTPAKSRIYKDKVREVAEIAMRQRCVETLDCPIHLSIIIYKEVPQSWSQKKKDRALAHEIEPIGKPDVDNQAKAIMDGITAACLWADDARVVSLYVAKHYGEEPCAEVFVEVDDA